MAWSRTGCLRGAFALTAFGMLSGGADAAPRASDRASCAAARVAVERFQAENPADQLIVSLDAPRLPPGASGVAFLRRGWSGHIPGSETVVNFAKSELKSALTCASVSSSLEDAKIKKLGHAETEVALRSLPGDKGPIYVWKISLPVLNRKKDEAIVLISQSSNALSGGSYIVFLRCRSGVWVGAGKKNISLS